MRKVSAAAVFFIICLFVAFGPPACMYMAMSKPAETASTVFGR